MANYIMGYWDCQYCGTKGNRGDRRECESCGHPRDESVKFYMKNTTHVSKETASSISKNPDWYCSYCNTLNSDNDSNCKGCGASKNESEKNYFTMRNTPSAPAPVQKTSRANPLKFLGILAAIAFVLFLIFKPRDKAAEIKDFSWYRSIDIEKYVEVEESDWSLPSEATLIRSAEELHHTDSVFDHYEEYDVEHSREVLDGYDTEVEYVDMGNGYFEERTYDVPRYRTEYYTERERRAVYRDVPVYETKYYYRIWRWKYDRTIEASEDNHRPYWPELSLGTNEREGSKSEKYYVTILKKKKSKAVYSASYKNWEELKEGESIILREGNGSNEAYILDSGKDVRMSLTKVK